MFTRARRTAFLAAIVALPLSVGSAVADPLSPSAAPTTSDLTSTSSSASLSAMSAASPVATASGSNSPVSSTTSVAPTASSSSAAPSSSSSSASATSAPHSVRRMAAQEPAIAVGSHVSSVVDQDVLGAPVAVEGHWASAGGGWVQQFQNGWALVSDGGQSGVVTGSLLPYFTAHGYVNATGWPMGNAVTDSSGTYQKFDSKGSVISGALMASSAGTFRVQGGMYATYFGKGLRSVLGSPTGEEVRWSAGGGGWAQSFSGGWLLYKNTAVNGYIPSSFAWPNLNTLGWPKGGPQSTCGGQGIVFERGTLMSNGSTCAPAKPTPPAPVSGYTLYPGNPGWNGVKAYLAELSLGMRTSPTSTTMGSLSDATSLASHVKSFQSTHGISATGNLDLTTFTALKTGYSFGIDVWKQPAQVSAKASRSTRGNEAANFARKQAGKPYIWGGTGPMGYDCAGLAIQALRSGGFDPKNVSNYFDVYPSSDLSNQMWKDTTEFKSVSSPAVGDMAFWGFKNGVVHHMAMYLGNGQWIQAINQGVVISSGGIAGAEAKNGWSHGAFFGYRQAIR